LSCASEAQARSAKSRKTRRLGGREVFIEFP
jgi:hypothetical protein